MSVLRSRTTVDSAQALRVLMGADFTLSEQQWAAVCAPLSPAVVIAGAGSGKTSLMAARVVYLVANGLVAPEQVLGLTFTTKATAELRQRIRSALGAIGAIGPPPDPDPAEDRLEPTVATYNAYAARLLSEHGLRIGHEPDTRVLADASRYQLAARAIAHHTGRVRLLSDSPAHVIDWVLALDAAMSEHLVTIEEVGSFDDLLRPEVVDALAAGPKGGLPDFGEALDKRAELLDLVAGYRVLKDGYGVMDFSDQIALAARLVREHPEVAQVERDRFRVVLLDEYQDTSVAQARLLQGLFSGPDPASGLGHPVMAVGDPHQAIYGWRGASVSNIVHFHEDFPASHTTPSPPYALTVNRRSDARILEVANRLVEPLRQAGSTTAPRMEAKPGALAGSVRTIVHETYDEELAWLAGGVLDARAGLIAREAEGPADERRSGLWREIGVLTRDNQHAADVFDALTAAGVPVEIVGLKGLLRLPEVSQVVATLTLLADLTANAELLALLTGPRWAIGPRDLALLGARARELARPPGGYDHDRADPAAALDAAVAGADPTEVAALGDALADPGERRYSAQARERFALLAAELRHLRGHADEPLLDLVRRIIAVSGIDVELASCVGEAARARRDNLDLFVKAVGDFQAVDGEVGLPALLAYLGAEDELGGGMDVATPTEADSVKLLTVHRAKGLEWDVVFVPGVCAEKFPHARLRNQWTKSAHVLPVPLRGDARDLPALTEVSADGLKQFLVRAREHQQEEELRLAYVAMTRARHALWVSSYCWTASRRKPVGPSPYQRTVASCLAAWGERPDRWQEPDPTAANPALLATHAASWPATTRTVEAVRRVDAVERLGKIAQQPRPADEGLRICDQERVAAWDADAERLLAEARRDRGGLTSVVEVPRPGSLSATALARLRDDPQGFARDLARPMPRRPSSSARFGTRFHAWVEARFGQIQLVDPDDLPGRADSGIDDESDLAELIARFEAGPFAERVPEAVEAGFAVVLAGQVVRGRIDAVYADGPGRFLVVDWKTGREPAADPLQLAVYRLAWAELTGVPVDAVGAAFHYVRTGRTVLLDGLPGRAEIEALLDQS